jgi:hypothetical protein
MDIRNLTRDDVRQILRASEGIPSQISAATIVNGRVSAARVGHPISSHLHSAEFAAPNADLVAKKTKFLSMDDMVEAFWQLLQTSTAAAQISNLVAGQRTTVKTEVGSLFGFECEVPDPQGRGTVHRVRFTPEEQRRAGRWKTTCVAVVEIRERAGRPHLQIHSFYPAVSQSDVSQLLNAIRNHPGVR